MRLIDADVLIKEVEDFPNCYNGWSDAYDKAYIIGAIEEAPTIEPKTKVIAQVTFDEDKLREIVHEAVERIKEEYDIVDRPQGEWIIEYNGNGWNDYWNYTCSNCGKKYERADVVLYNARYCPNCGARMKGVGND